MKRRSPIRAGVLGLVVLAALTLAAFNIEELPLIGGGTSYHAAFRDASGLAAGNEVRVAGVKVGKVTAVELAREPSPGASESGRQDGDAVGVYVRVIFRITDRELALGEQTAATIRIKTVLGQKYLALDPAGPGALAAGAEIPLTRTASPFDVLQAVTGLAETLDRIDTEQLAQAFEVLADTFRDTPESVQTSLTGLSRLSQTIASRDEQLRTLLDRAHTVTTVLADRDAEFRRLVADGNLLLAEVAKRRDAIHQLLLATIELSNQLSGLISDSREELNPALRELRAVIAILQRNRDQLEQSLTSMAPFVALFANVVGNGRWFDSYVDGLLQPYAPGGVS